MQDEGSTSQLKLRDILTNPSSLSYFMEFMDRRGRSLPVQFWLTVESFKNPLESVDSGSSDEDYEPLANQSSTTTLKEDLSMINDLYFAGSSTPLTLSAISQKHVDAIRQYVSLASATPLEERKARRSVMLAQRQVEQNMDHDFEEFRNSDLWFRAVSDLNAKERTSLPSAPSAAPMQSGPSSSSGGRFLASLVQGLTPELHRSSSNTNNATQPRRLYPANSRPSQETERPSVPSAPMSRSVSAQAMTSSLEILMSPTATDQPTDRAPLFDETEDGRLISADAEEAQRMEAIQAAVTDIIATESRQSPDKPSSNRSSETSLDKALDGLDGISINSKRRGIFDDTYSIREGEVVPEDEDDDTKANTFELPPPGNLHLSGEVVRLSDKITHLQSQDVILDALIRKAELTGDAQELRVLQKSKSALERELRQLSFQKTQYEQQDNANRLIPGRTKAYIVNSTSGEEEGKQVVRYLIQVQQLGPTGVEVSGWVVARRYSEFLAVHQRLKERFLNVKNLDFPGKRLVTTLSTNLVDNRRVALEKYLQVSLFVQALPLRAA